MSDFPTPAFPALPLHISTLSQWSLGGAARQMAGSTAPASRTWVANLAVFVPLSLPFDYPVNRVWWMNGSTASSNVDMGIYTVDGVRIYSTTSQAQSGASSVQYITPGTPFVLAAGDYYLAWVVSGTTNRAWGGSATAARGKGLGLLEQASALPLPDPATFATFATVAFFPYCGITRTASGF